MSGPGAGHRGLIRLPNWIGDAVMAAPAVLGLGRARPDWDWFLLGNARSRPLFLGLDAPFRMLPALPAGSSRPGGLLRTARDLARLDFEAVLVLPPSFSSALAAALAGIPVRVGRGGEGRGGLLTGPLPGLVRTRHLREQYAETASALLDRIGSDRAPWSVPWDACRLPLRADELVWADEWYRQAGVDPCAALFLAPGAAYGPTKRWPPERFTALGAGLLGEGWNLILLGGPEEADLCREMAAALGDRGRRPGAGQVLSAAGGLSLRESMAVLSQGRAAVSNDSGAMHLAQAAGCPVLGIFGSTSPRWTGPARPGGRFVYQDLHCSPCFSTRCPTSLECLGEIAVRDVRGALDRLLEETGRALGRPAVFLDRDGTLLELVPYLNSPGQVRLAEGAGPALRRLREAGFALVVVTNQSAVARGLLDLEGLREIHLRMEELLRQEGVALDGIEYCPHHPDHTGPCACRKPEPGLLRRAAHSLNLDPAHSYLVGDSNSDLQAGVRAGVRTLLVRTGYGREVEEAYIGSSTRPSGVVDNLAGAADWILSDSAASR